MNKNKINEIGHLLLSELEGDTSSLKRYTTEQLCYIVSLQNNGLIPYCEISTKTLRFKFLEKRRTGGHVDLNRIRQKFSSS